MKTRQRKFQNIKVIALCISSNLATTNCLAIDLESTYLKHTEYCMSQLNTEKSNLFERLFGEETTDQCMQYAIEKTREEFDTAFFETQITDQEYRRKRAFFEENVDNKNTETLGGKNNRLIENQMIISDKNKEPEDSLPTAAGFKSIGARSSGGE